MPSDAFSETTTPVDNAPKVEDSQAAPPPVGGAAFSELVGEGKKFRDAEALAESKQASDSFIEKLQGELAELRTDLDRRLTAEEVAVQIRQEAQSATEGNTTPALSEERIQTLVQTTIESTRTEETKGKNLQTADDKLAALYGDKRQDWLRGKASELGVSVDFLADVAKTSPDAFFNTIGVSNETAKSDPNVMTRGVDTQRLADTNSHAPNANSKAHFDQLRKEKPREYWKPATQNAIMASQAAGTYL